MNPEINALKSELALIKRQFSYRIDAVESRLNTLTTQEKQHPVEADNACAHIEEAHSKPSRREEQTTEIVVAKTAEQYQALNARKEPAETSKPSFISIIFQAILASIFDWISPVLEIYQSYKERGLLGIFILTMVGIGLTLAGFGYLMQLLIEQLDAGAKSLLMCFAAILVMAIGIALKIKTRFAEFATAIVTLGILLSYSTVYFSGSVFGIIPNVAVLLLYLLIALLCHLLAHRLETKIVAGLGIMGIATMPTLSNTIQMEPFYYLLSLAFVTTSSLILAYKKSEPWLTNLSLVCCIVALEWTIGIEAVKVSAWLVNLFYLLFLAYIAMTLFFNKVSNHKALVLLAALVGSTVLFFFQASNLFSTQISLIFVCNALIAAGIGVIFNKAKHNLTHFLVLLAALWTVLAVVSAISTAYWGIAWAIEGLLLLYIGRRHVMTIVVNQGQILTALALVYCWSTLARYFPLPALRSVDGWVLSLVIVAIMAIWQRLINDSTVFDQLKQRKVKPLLQLLEVVWLSVLLISSLHLWIGNWTGPIIIFLQLALLWRAKQCQQVSIEIFSASLILVALGYAYNGALIVDSFRFMMLPLFAKLAVVSAFLQLWLWSAFYRKYQPNSAIKAIAEHARILFYMLLPICWLGSAIRRLDENALMIIWLSPLLALFLAYKVKSQLLVKETKLLTIIASLAFILGVGLMDLTDSLITLIGFMLLYGAAFYFNNKVAKAELCQFICSWGVLSLGFAVPSMILFHSDSLFSSLVVASVLWVSYLSMLHKSQHLKRNETFITFINAVLIITAWGLTFVNAMFVLIPVIFIISIIFQKNAAFKQTQLGMALGLNINILLHTLAAISYITLLSALEGYRYDLFIAPTLAIQGAIILFMQDRRAFTVKYSFGLIFLAITKLAIIDAAHAQLWQKVILFMGIGAFILAATFWYQKLVEQTEQTPTKS